MKGFKMTAKGGIKSGHHFGENHGFTGSSGRVQNVNGYTRRVVHKAEGGQVKGPGNAAVVRTEPTTDLDEQYGGRGPLRPGYKTGGTVTPKKVNSAFVSHIKAPKPGGHGVKSGKGFNRVPLIGK